MRTQYKHNGPGAIDDEEEKEEVTLNETMCGAIYRVCFSVLQRVNTPN